MRSASGQVRRVPRRTTGAPLEEGRTLVPLVRSLATDQSAWLAVVVRSAHIDLIDPRPFARHPREIARFIAGLSRSRTSAGGAALAVGLAGNLQVSVRARHRGQQVQRSAPVAVAFLEAPDCDWWLWQRFLGVSDGSRAAGASEGAGVPDRAGSVDDRAPSSGLGADVAGPEQVLAARRGDALPAGLGRWWSLGRRTGVRVTLTPTSAIAVPAETSPHVH